MIRMAICGYSKIVVVFWVEMVVACWVVHGDGMLVGLETFVVCWVSRSQGVHMLHCAVDCLASTIIYLYAIKVSAMLRCDSIKEQTLLEGYQAAATSTGRRSFNHV